MIQIVLVALAFVFAFSNNGLCREFHVSAVTGSNQNTGDAQYPLKTIQALLNVYFREIRLSYMRGYIANVLIQYKGGQKSNLSFFKRQKVKR